MKRIFTTLRHTLYRFRGQILGWGLGLAALGLIIVPFYGVFGARQEEFKRMIENYPKEFLAFFGADPTSVLTPEGYIGMYAFSMLPVIIGIFAVMAGSGLLVADEEHGRLDLIVAHPVGRSALFFGRALALAAAALGIMLVAWLGFCLPLSASHMGLTWGQMALPFLPLLAQTLVYAALALLLSMLLPSRSLAATLAGLVMVASYMLSSLSSLDARLAAVARWLPYAYYDGARAIHNLNWAWLLGLLACSAVMTLLAWQLFLRREIRVSGEGSLRLPALPLLGKRSA